MDTNQSALKAGSKIALTALGVLLLGAVVFFKERLFADTAYIAFNIVDSRQLCIQNQRYGSFITQIVPWLALKLHLPITQIVFAYSISFNLFFFCVSAIIIAWFKEYKLGILMAFFYLLLVSDSYFLENDELLQGVAWLFLCFAATLYMVHKKVSFVFLLFPFSLLSFLSLSSHFITIIPIVFLFVYFIIDRKDWPFSNKQTFLLSGTLALIFLVKMFLSQALPYESKHLHGATHFSLHDIIISFGRPVVRMFLYRCLVNYWWAIIIFIIGLVSLWKKNQKKLFGWSLLSCIGYIILMGLTYADDASDTLLAHIELEWQCLGIIVATPFVFSFLPGAKPLLAALLLTAIFATRLVYISAAIPAFTQHTQFIEDILAKMRQQHITKLAVISDNSTRSTCILDWSVPQESMLLSAMHGDNPSLTVCFVAADNKRIQELATEPKKFWNTFAFYPSGDLNKTYFNIDTTQPYRIMRIQEFFK